MSEGERDPARSLSVIYDGQCPFCANFMQLYRLRENVGELELIDARQAPALVRELRAMGMEINGGMVVRWRGQYHFGADGMQLLATLGADQGIFGRLNHVLFHKESSATIWYPLLSAGRRLTLRLLRRKPIA